MQSFKPVLKALPLALTLVAGSAAAQPFANVDARAMAMGGAGVAVGYVGSAPLFNPALLAGETEDSFSLLFPQIGVRVADPEDMLDASDDFQDDVDELDAASDNWDAKLAGNTETNADKQRVIDAGLAIIGLGSEEGSLAALSGKPIEMWAGAAMVAGMPSETLGWAVSVSSMAVGGGIVLGTAADATYIQTAIIDQAINDQPTNFDENQLQSELLGRGVHVTEIGVSLAHKFDDGFGGLQVGITPKLLEVTTFDYALNASNQDFAFDEGEEDDSGVNFDIGVLKELPAGLRIGAVVKNVISQEYDTVLGNEIELKPQIRAGVGFQTGIVNLAADLDLAENDPVGIEQPTQYLALGAEFDFTAVQLRAGYRNNLAAEGDADENVFTAGIGFWLGFHLDLGVAGNSEEIAASLQTGFRF